MTDQPDYLDDARLVRWPWPAVLLVCIEAQSTEERVRPGSRFMFVAPTAQGLEALEQSEQPIESIWLLASGVEEAGMLHAEQVREISTWNLRTPGGQQLSVLRGEKGRLIAIEDDDAFVLQPSSTDWTGSGLYKRERSMDAVDQSGADE